MPGGGRARAPTSSSFGIGPDTLEDTLETIRLIGEHVIPKIDTDPEHRTEQDARRRGLTLRVAQSSSTASA